MTEADACTAWGGHNHAGQTSVLQGRSGHRVESPYIQRSVQGCAHPAPSWVSLEGVFPPTGAWGGVRPLCSEDILGNFSQPAAPLSPVTVTHYLPKEGGWPGGHK